MYKTWILVWDICAGHDDDEISDNGGGGAIFATGGDKGEDEDAVDTIILLITFLPKSE